MFNNNPYTLSTKSVGSITKYYVSFKDGQGVFHEIEISHPVYLEFLQFIKIEQSLGHWDERHRERFELTDEELYERALHTPKSVDEVVFENFRNEELRQIIRNLPEIQRRRFILRYDYGLTFVQIADIENCSVRAVKYSFDIAEKK